VTSLSLLVVRLTGVLDLLPLLQHIHKKFVPAIHVRALFWLVDVLHDHKASSTPIKCTVTATEGGAAAVPAAVASQKHPGCLSSADFKTRME